MATRKYIRLFFLPLVSSWHLLHSEVSGTSAQLKWEQRFCSLQLMLTINSTVANWADPLSPLQQCSWWSVWLQNQSMTLFHSRGKPFLYPKEYPQIIFFAPTRTPEAILSLGLISLNILLIFLSNCLFNGSGRMSSPQITKSVLKRRQVCSLYSLKESPAGSSGNSAQLLQTEIHPTSPAM